MKTHAEAEGVSPGSILKQELQERGWSQADFAEVLGRPVQAVNEILKGKKSITATTARELEGALETPAQFWLNLETAYRLSLEAQNDREVARRSKLFSRTPIADLRRRGWIRDTKDTSELEADVVRLLRLNHIDDPPSMRFAARKSTDYRKVEPEQEAWCSRSRQLAESLSVNRFTQKKLQNSLGELRSLASDEAGVAEVPDFLAGLGVRFVVVEHLPRTKIDGATFWLSKARPVVAVSLRYGRIDHFWFTLFHEIAHIRHGDCLSIDSDIMDSAEQMLEIEQRANEVAAETLVPQKLLEAFVVQHGQRLSKSRIIQFSREVSIHPGIVLGQLQHRGVVNWSRGREMLVSIREEVADAALTDGWGRKITL